MKRETKGFVMDVEKIIPLLCLGVTTVTIVQGVLIGTALPQIVAEFNVDYGFMGLLMALWTLLLAVSPFVLGGFVDRLDPFVATFTVLLVSSVSTLLNAAARDLITFNVVRIVASLLAAPYPWPLCSRIVATFVGRSRTGFAVATFNTGSMLGLSASYLIMWLTGNNWRAAMLASGILGIAYLPAPLLARRLMASNRRTSVEFDRNILLDNGSSNDERLVNRIAAFLFAGHFAALYTWGLLMSWLSTFLVAELKLSYGQVTVYMTIIALFSAFLEVLVGVYTDKLGGLKWRTAVLYAGLWPSTLLLFLSLLTSTSELAALLISLSLLGWRVSSTSFWSIVNDITPSNHYGRVSRVFVSAAPLSGIASSVVNGFIVSFTGSLRAGILLSAILQLFTPIFFKKSTDLGLKLKNRGKV
ncbi:MAG: MFS transporter [Thermofilaceae archaeon]|nr:MFS transporter [Thermofilaceae archaeon]MCX8180481.1 MFS transporter [Thermofilaceae archaeon]MDW8003322.1 MFS transporter [Thermofilaceae archaeon]